MDHALAVSQAGPGWFASVQPGESAPTTPLRRVAGAGRGVANRSIGIGARSRQHSTGCVICDSQPHRTARRDGCRVTWTHVRLRHRLRTGATDDKPFAEGPVEVTTASREERFVPLTSDVTERISPALAPWFQRVYGSQAQSHWSRPPFTPAIPVQVIQTAVQDKTDQTIFVGAVIGPPWGTLFQ